MSNITVRRGNEGTMAPTTLERDPFRMFRDFFRWDPFREMAPFIPTTEAAAFAPAFEVKETKDAFVFKADVPGVKEKDLEVTLTGNRLSISGKREGEKEEKAETYYTYERSYGSFTRAFTLPEGVDTEHLAAEIKEGVLTLVVPKRPEVKARNIPVAAGTGAKS